MGNPFGRSEIIPLTNQSGGSVAAGDVVYLDTAHDDSFITGTTANYTGAIGVAQQTIGAGSVGLVLTSGYASLVNVNSSVTRGHFGATYTVAKQATDAGASRAAGTFCQFLKGGTTPDAYIWQPDLGGGSGMTNPMTTTGDMIYSSSGSTPARLAAVAAGQVLVSAGVSTAPAWAQFPLLGYNADTSANHTSTGATLADVDATNCKVTFVAPASGNVLVRLTAVMSPDSSGAANVGAYTSWGLREGTTDIAGAVGSSIAGRCVVSSLSVIDIRSASMTFVLTGISAGSHTYKWSYATSAGTTELYASASNPAVMEVWAL